MIRPLAPRAIGVILSLIALGSACSSQPSTQATPSGTTVTAKAGNACSTLTDREACAGSDRLVCKALMTGMSATWQLISTCPLGQTCWSTNAAPVSGWATECADAPVVVSADATSSSDTNSLCGNKTCDPGETATCPDDCPVGDGCGDLDCGSDESLALCPVDCGDGFLGKKACALANCSSAWVTCVGDPTCTKLYNCRLLCGALASCVTTCNQKASSATTAAATALDACFSGPCHGNKPIFCGDGQCSAPTETVETCPADCKVTCGDGICSPAEVCAVDCGPPAGACASADDQAVVQAIVNDPGVAQTFALAVSDCVFTKGCQGKPSPGQQKACMSACIAGELGFSSDCSSCYGVYGSCVASNCATQCKPTAQVTCTSCMSSNCQSGLNS